MSDYCGQEGVCAEAPGCSRHWGERVREVMEERDESRAEVERLRAELSALRVQRATERARDGWAEVERLRDALRAIAEGFDTISGSVDDPSAKQVDGYFRGYAQAALEKGTKP